MQTERRSIYHMLDALRGLAAICVMCYHYGRFLSSGSFIGSSYLAVDLFFALSGFVIAHAYDAKLERGLGFWAFLRIRLTRLHPLYILGTAIGFIFVLVRNVAEPTRMVPMADLLVSLSKAIFLVPDTENTENLVGTFPFDQAAWSLSFELAINLLYVAFYRLLTIRRIVFIISACAAALILCSFRDGDLDLGMTPATLSGGIARAGFSFFMGVLIFRTRGAPASLMAPVGFVLVGVVFAVFAVSPVGWMRSVFDLVCTLALFPIVICLASRCDPLPVVGPLFDWAALVSYPIYILHGPVLEILTWLTRHVFAETSEQLRPFSGIAFVIVMLIVSRLSIALYEQPIRRRLEALALRNDGAASPQFFRQSGTRLMRDADLSIPSVLREAPIPEGPI